MGITIFISLYTTRLVLNALGASDFGIFNVVGGAIAMLGFLHAAMSSATQRFMSFYEGKGDKEKQKYIFNVSSVLHFGIAIGLVLVLLVAGYFFFNGILNIPPDRVFAAKVIYGSLILSTAFTVMSVPYEAVLNAHENMLYYSIVGIVESVLKLTVALIIVYYAGDKLVLYGILMAVIPFVIRTIMQVYCHKKYEECVIAPRTYFEKGLMKEMASFAGWNLVGMGSGLVGNYGSMIIVNHFFGTIINAALGVVNQLNGQLMAFSNNMLKALNPVVVKKQGEGNQNEMMYFSLIGSKLSFLIFAVFAIPVLIETSYILTLWLKNVPEWTMLFIQLALIKSLLEQLTVTLNTALAAIGDIKGLSLSNILANILPLPILYILFLYDFEPFWLYIVGITFMVGFGTGFKIYYSVKLCNLSISELFKIVILPCVVVCVLSFLGGSTYRLFLDKSLFRLLLVGLTTGLILVLGTYLTMGKREREVFNGSKKMIANKINNKKKEK
ncbi:hypothetical protein [Zobellia roscoffensis]